MDGHNVTAYLKKFCKNIDHKLPLESFDDFLRRVVVPAALPAAVVLTMGLGGCVSNAVGMYGAPPPDTEHCADGHDNDGDGLIDCADDECAGLEVCGAEANDVYGAPLPEDDPPPQDQVVPDEEPRAVPLYGIEIDDPPPDQVFSPDDEPRPVPAYAVRDH